MPCSLTHLGLIQLYIERSEKVFSEVEKIQLTIGSILPDVLKKIGNNRNKSHFCGEQKQREISLDQLIKNFIDVNGGNFSYMGLGCLSHLTADHTWVPGNIKQLGNVNNFAREDKIKIWRGIMLSNDKKFFSDLSREIQQEITKNVELAKKYVEGDCLCKELLPENYQDINIESLKAETLRFIEIILGAIKKLKEPVLVLENNLINYKTHVTLGEETLKRIFEIEQRIS